MAAAATINHPTSQKKSKKSTNIPLQSNLVKMINPHAAGIDIHSEIIWVCVPEERSTPYIKTFPAFTADLYSIADWLKECHISSVAMESTGIYWIPLYQILEQSGFNVCLVNAKHIKNVSGRPKTDKYDCQWIQRLHAYGFLSPSFRPANEICNIRSIQRHRDNLIRQTSWHIQHMQKALHEMNLILDKVISDITGTTGILIIQAILNGEHDPVKLAQLKNHRVKSSEEQIAKALTGDYRPNQIFILKQAFEAYQYTKQQIHQCDVEIENLLSLINKEVESNILTPPTKRYFKTPRNNDFKFDLRTYLYQIFGVDLTAIPGFQASLILKLFTEIGPNLDAFQSEKHFSSWLGLSPNKKKSAGKVISSHTSKGSPKASNAFILAARAAGQCKSSYIGSFYRRLKYKIGAPKAITATAHKLAIIYYHMVKNKKEYIELGDEFYLNKQKEASIERIKQQAKSLGFDLVPQS
jgi:transposase